MKKPHKNSGISASDHIADISNMVTFSRHFNGVKKNARFPQSLVKKGFFRVKSLLSAFFAIWRKTHNYLIFPVITGKEQNHD